MGGTSSRDDGSESRWGVFLLCGGTENVIDDTDATSDAAPPPFLQNYARRSQRLGEYPSTITKTPARFRNAPGLRARQARTGTA